MTEKERLTEKEHRGVLELLLKKNRLTRKEHVDSLLGVWMASWVDTMTEDGKKQIPHLAF